LPACRAIRPAPSTVASCAVTPWRRQAPAVTMKSRRTTSICIKVRRPHLCPGTPRPAGGPRSEHTP
jgi:hypothetical protein